MRRLWCYYNGEWGQKGDPFPEVAWPDWLSRAGYATAPGWVLGDGNAPVSVEVFESDVELELHPMAPYNYAAHMAPSRASPFIILVKDIPSLLQILTMVAPLTKA